MARYDQCDKTCTADCGHCKGQGKPQWAIVDLESAEAGGILTVAYRSNAYGNCLSWLMNHKDQEKVNRGGFGIDGPADY